MTQPDDPRDRDLDDAYRDAAREQPPGDLDARIRAAAHRAVNARPMRVRPWHERWRAPVAVAATIVLSVGLVLTIQHEAPHAPLPTEAPHAPLPTEAPHAPLPTEAPQGARPTPPVPATQEPAPPRIEERVAPPAPLSAEPRAAPPAAPVERGAGAPLPGQPSPAPAIRGDAREKRPEATATDNAVTPSPPPRAIQPSAPPAPAAAPPPETRREQQAAPGQAVPAPAAAPAPAPAMRSAPGAPLSRERSLEMERPARAPRDAGAGTEPRTPEAWVEEIRRLKAAGLVEEADRALAELRLRYPDFALPADLRN